MKHLGNYAEDFADLNTKFTTVNTSGVPTALSGGAISVYKSNGTTQSTAGVTLTADFDSVTGLNNVNIDLSADAFYAPGEDYQIVITAGTVGGSSVVGYVVAEFAIEARKEPIALTAGTIADAVWDEAMADHVGASSFGAALGGIPVTIDSTSATTTSFRTNLTDDNDTFNDRVLYFTSGDLTGISRPILDFTSVNGVITLDEALPSTPANGVTAIILNQHVHPISQIQSGLARTGADSDTLETLSDQIDGISGGGDATLAKQNEILGYVQNITTANVNVVGPTVDGDQIVITRGDTYPAAEGIAGLTFTIASGENWPDDPTDGWTFAMTFREVSDNIIDDGTSPIAWTSSNCTITPSGTGTTRKVIFSDFSRSVMANLSTGQHVYKFDIQASKSNMRMTLRTGTVTVIQDQTTS